MRVAGGEKAILFRKARILLDREEQFRHRLFEAPAEETRGPYLKKRVADPGAGTESQRGLDMLDCNVRLACISPEDTADVPAIGVVRVERQRTVDQRHHGADVLSKKSEREGGMRQDARVVAGHFQGPPCEIWAL